VHRAGGGAGAQAEGVQGQLPPFAPGPARQHIDDRQPPAAAQRRAQLAERLLAGLAGHRLAGGLEQHVQRLRRVELLARAPHVQCQ
jgi:hypothetical protein